MVTYTYYYACWHYHEIYFSVTYLVVINSLIGGHCYSENIFNK